MNDRLITIRYPDFIFGALAITFMPPQTMEFVYVLHVSGSTWHQLHKFLEISTL